MPPVAWTFRRLLSVLSTGHPAVSAVETLSIKASPSRTGWFSMPFLCRPGPTTLTPTNHNGLAGMVSGPCRQSSPSPFFVDIACSWRVRLSPAGNHEGDDRELLAVTTLA